MSLQAVMVLAAALLCTGLFGVLTQQSVVMLMMGLELMLGGVVATAAGTWHHLAPDRADGQVIVLVAVTAMALEMAIGFAVVTALFREREVDVTDRAAELKE
ncbi:NADH-quinone oxidoreductase subunit NuoK [Streptomyces griseus]|uniref:NADH-quinone oxidoreductase subunit NuoK n=1 Tax=Streptomyces griseus TaxID=1911 RepID=UPI000840577B|nr:NADH-quinone oxidoreductase subunit K [Streptomyces griseus]